MSGVVLLGVRALAVEPPVPLDPEELTEPDPEELTDPGDEPPDPPEPPDPGEPVELLAVVSAPVVLPLAFDELHAARASESKDVTSAAQAHLRFARGTTGLGPR